MNWELLLRISVIIISIGMIEAASKGRFSSMMINSGGAMRGAGRDMTISGCGCMVAIIVILIVFFLVGGLAWIR